MGTGILLGMGTGILPGMGPISCPAGPGHAPCQAQGVLPGTREGSGFFWVSHRHLVIHFPPRTCSSPRWSPLAWEPTYGWCWDQGLQRVPAPPKRARRQGQRSPAPLGQLIHVLSGQFSASAEKGLRRTRAPSWDFFFCKLILFLPPAFGRACGDFCLALFDLRSFQLLPYHRNSQRQR